MSSTMLTLATARLVLEPVMVYIEVVLTLARLVTLSTCKVCTVLTTRLATTYVPDSASFT